MGHFSNKCPQPKREKANATLLEPQLAGAMLEEPQLFAIVLGIPKNVPVVSVCENDSESECLSDDDPGLALMFENAFGPISDDVVENGLVELERARVSQTCEDPVVLETSVVLVEPPVAAIVSLGVVSHHVAVIRVSHMFLMESGYSDL